jgi:4-hydroxy 2-oxovalerate aldolase
VEEYCEEKKPIVISVNLLSPDYPIHYAYFSNKKRYNYWKNSSRFDNYKKIVTSNIIKEASKNETIIDFTKLVKSGWKQLDNSGILLLRLLDQLHVASIAIAGFDGYSHDSTHQNYAQKEFEKQRDFNAIDESNRSVASMLEDYKNNRFSDCPIIFITPSRFANIF